MRVYKIHIKKNNDQCFCGNHHTIWRQGYTEVKEDRDLVKKPKASDPLPTGSFEEATCRRCITNFILVAKTLRESGSLVSFIKAAA